MQALTPESLTEVIQAAVEPQSWDEEGGTGACIDFPPSGALVVTQSYQIQRQVAALLDEIRTLRRMDGAVPAAKVAANAQPAPAETCIVVYYLKPMGPPPLVRWLAPEAATGKQDLEELTKCVVESIGRDKWPEQTTSIRCVGGQFIIRQTPEVQEQIGKLLNGLSVLERKKEIPAVGGNDQGKANNQAKANNQGKE